MYLTLEIAYMLFILPDEESF